MSRKKKYSSKRQQDWIRKHVRECHDCDSISGDCLVTAWDEALKGDSPEPSRQVKENRRVAEQRQRYVEMSKQANGDFKVPAHLYREFAFDLISGLGFCMRKYGASKEQIIAEAKRIVPYRDVSLLRE